MKMDSRTSAFSIRNTIGRRCRADRKDPQKNSCYKIVQLNEEVLKGQLKELVRGSVEETLNELLEQEAEKLTQAARYERNEARRGYRSGHYSRNLTVTSSDVTLHVPRLKGGSFETAIIERYRRREILL